MSKFLIHIHSGPDLKNKATLGMLVALTAFKKGDEVNIFLAADGTYLLNVKNEGEVVGQRIGDLKIHLDELRENNINAPKLINSYYQNNIIEISDLGKKSYQQLYELGFVNVPFNNQEQATTNVN